MRYSCVLVKVKHEFGSFNDNRSVVNMKCMVSTNWFVFQCFWKLWWESQLQSLRNGFPVTDSNNLGDLRSSWHNFLITQKELPKSCYCSETVQQFKPVLLHLYSENIFLHPLRKDVQLLRTATFFLSLLLW